jgi:hypothetical protein
MEPFYIETPFGFSIDMSFWQNFASYSTLELIGAVFALLVWWLIAIFLFRVALKEWQAFKQKEFLKTWQWAVLAVDVPFLFVQSPKAVEQIFVHLSGAHVNYSVYDRYFNGKLPKWFSFEIISIEGYIQFLVRTEVEFRDLVEAAIYAQYSEAEITEVEDYVSSVPDKFPDPNYDAQGIEFGLSENEVYPIRTYSEFEYTISKDVVFSDPMAAILENFTRIGPGEHLWMHLAVLPVDNSWKQTGIDLVKKIIANKKEPPKNSVTQFIGDAPLAILKTAKQAWEGNFEAEEEKKKKEDAVGKISDMSPGAKAVIESIEDKIAKIGFKSRLRVVYAAKKDVYKPSKCLHGLIGAMNQFYINNRNGFKAKMMKAEEIVPAFKARQLKLDTEPYIMNIEELATVWHFPLPLVKTPLLQKADIKRAEPPINLPVENFETPLRRKPVGPVVQEKPVPAVPEEIPYA